MVRGRVSFVAYLGNTLRYDVEAGPGQVLKADIRDPWHHEPLSDRPGGRGQLPRLRHAGRRRRCLDPAGARRSGGRWAWGSIWLFLALFLVYPLTRIFYDAVTDEAGRLTLANFAAFFTDSFYLRALWKSLVLGVATVAASSVIGIAVAFLLVRYDFRGAVSSAT